MICGQNEFFWKCLQLSVDNFRWLAAGKGLLNVLESYSMIVDKPIEKLVLKSLWDSCKKYSITTKRSILMGLSTKPSLKPFLLEAFVVTQKALLFIQSRENWNGREPLPYGTWWADFHVLLWNRHWKSGLMGTSLYLELLTDRASLTIQ